MGKFGNAGVRTKRVSLGFVRVDISAGEYLHYHIKVRGAVPIFSLSHGGILAFDQTTFGLPSADYDRNGPPLSGDPLTDEDYVFGCSFVGATVAASVKYTLLVDHRDAAGNVVETVKDIDYESTDPTDTFVSEFFTVHAV